MTDEQKESILELRRNGLGYNQIALEVGVTTDAVRNFFYKRRKTGAEKTQKVTILNRRIRTLQNQILKYKMREEADLDFARSITVPKYDVKFNTNFVDGPEVGIVNFSDLHFGALIKSKINTYNPKIAQIRVGYYIDRINHIFSKYYPHIKRLKIFMNGDIPDGSGIYEGQHYETIPIDEQIAFLPSILAAGLSQIRLPFEVYETDGNHGRLSKNSGIHNWDRVVAYLVQRMLPDVKFHIASDYYQVVDVYKWRYIVMHGQYITRSSQPQSQIERAVGLYTSMFRSMGIYFDSLFLGHFHSHNWLPSAIVNGAICGSLKLAQTKIKNADRPSQALVVINQKRGIVDVRRIYLDDMDGNGEGIHILPYNWENVVE